MEMRETPVPLPENPSHRMLPRAGRAATWPILAIVYSIVVWAIVIGLAMLVGRWVLPSTDSSRLIPALIVITAVTAVMAGLITVDFLRRSRADSTADGVRFGAWATIVGMTADGILLVWTDFDLPGISEDKTLTLIAALFFGYPATLVAAWGVAGWRLRGTRG
jgi:hypothetical protein